MGMSHYDEVSMRVSSYLDNGDWESAYSYLKNGDQNKDLIATTILAQFYIQGIGIPEDVETGIEMLQRAVSEGCAEASGALAAYYQEGEKVPQDERKAFGYMLRAAELGDIDAMGITANSYMYGRGTEIDYGAAFEWAQKGAKLGSLKGMGALAMMLIEGNGVQKDPYQAAYWLREILKRDEEESFFMYALAVCLTDPFDEFGVVPNNDMLEEAFYWASKGVEMGNLDCHMLVAWFYETGNYVDQDYEMAYKYFKLAADNGHENSAELIKRYRRNIFGQHYLPQ